MIMRFALWNKVWFGLVFHISSNKEYAKFTLSMIKRRRFHDDEFTQLVHVDEFMTTNSQPRVQDHKSWFMNFGSRILVHKSWFTNLGSRILVHKSLFTNLGSRISVHESWFKNLGSQILVHKYWLTNFG